ncbi:MAG: chemotaxis protein CheW [Pseudobdellovibrionaceae bacterium]
MRALALDEFTLEMRLHYIETTLDSIERIKNYNDFFNEVKTALGEWISEAHSNKLNFFVNLLEIIKDAIAKGSLKVEDSARVCQILSEYLDLLKTHEDSEEFFIKSQETLHNRKEKNKIEKVQTYLQCLSHTHHFIVPARNVIEIVSNKKVFPLPLKQAGIYGLLIFRGQGIPVVNLSEISSELNANDKNINTCFVVCDYKDAFFALEVERTEDVVELASSEFQRCTEASVLSPLADFFVMKENKFLILLEIEKMVKCE